MILDLPGIAARMDRLYEFDREAIAPDKFKKGAWLLCPFIFISAGCRGEEESQPEKGINSMNINWFKIFSAATLVVCLVLPWQNLGDWLSADSLKTLVPVAVSGFYCAGRTFF